MLVALTERKEDLAGEFSWTSSKLNSAVFRAHPMCRIGKVSKSARGNRRRKIEMNDIDS